MARAIRTASIRLPHRAWVLLACRPFSAFSFCALIEERMGSLQLSPLRGLFLREEGGGFFLIATFHEIPHLGLERDVLFEKGCCALHLAFFLFCRTLEGSVQRLFEKIPGLFIICLGGTVAPFQEYVPCRLPHLKTLGIHFVEGKEANLFHGHQFFYAGFLGVHYYYADEKDDDEHSCGTHSGELEQSFDRHEVSS